MWADIGTLKPIALSGTSTKHLEEGQLAGHPLPPELVIHWLENHFLSNADMPKLNCKVNPGDDRTFRQQLQSLIAICGGLGHKSTEGLVLLRVCAASQNRFNQGHERHGFLCNHRPKQPLDFGL